MFLNVFYYIVRLYVCLQSSTPHTDRLLLDETGEIARRNTSSQALRFEAEKRNLDRSRTMKRLSEVLTYMLF